MILRGDNLELLNLLPENSVDSIVTDPPYGIKFMGKRWDYDVPSVEQWRACLRVLKPGGYLLSFAGTRTQHKIATAIEDAGFEIRDMIAWVYGSGFPKSVNMGNGLGTALKPALEPITVARKPFKGTLKKNYATHGTGVLNIDACRVQSDNKPYPNSRQGEPSADKRYDGVGFKMLPGERGGSHLGRFPANLIHDGTVPFPAAKGQQGKAKNDGTPSGNKVYGKLNNVSTYPEPRVDIDTTAARFFYCAKASRADRDYGCDSLPITAAADMVNRIEGSAGMNNPRAGAGRTSGARNNHPTVKPIELCRYLIRLVTPAGGLTLDPWAGSGSFGVAAALEGYQYLGMEKDAQHCHTANTRVSYAMLQKSVRNITTVVEYDSSGHQTGRYAKLSDVAINDYLALYGINTIVNDGRYYINGKSGFLFTYPCDLMSNRAGECCISLLLAPDNSVD